MFASNAFHPFGGGDTPVSVTWPPSSKRFAGAISRWIATVILMNGTSLFPYSGQE